jgi:diketogulonate reductase-like aldo/keto reductase
MGRWAAWRAIEAIHHSGRARFIGVSNFEIDQLVALVHAAEVRPRFVQNRCYAVTRWDRQVRTFCAENGITYQGFSFALDVGMVPLTGTTSADHMRTDLAVFDFHLRGDEVSTIEGVAVA